MAEEFPENIGTYKVLRELGRGAMGTVYLARQESLSRELAVKVLAAEYTRDAEFVAHGLGPLCDHLHGHRLAFGLPMDGAAARAPVYLALDAAGGSGAHPARPLANRNDQSEE